MILTEYKKNKDAKLFMGLLWDIDIKQFDFFAGKRIIIERTIEFGSLSDWYAILNMYGVQTVVEEIKNINSLQEIDINFIHKFLNIPLEDLKSYQNKLAGRKHWRE